MKYSYKNINILKEKLEKYDFISRGRINEKDYDQRLSGHQRDCV